METESKRMSSGNEYKVYETSILSHISSWWLECPRMKAQIDRISRFREQIRRGSCYKKKQGRDKLLDFRFDVERRAERGSRQRTRSKGRRRRREAGGRRQLRLATANREINSLSSRFSSLPASLLFFHLPYSSSVSAPPRVAFPFAWLPMQFVECIRRKSLFSYFAAWFTRLFVSVTPSLSLSFSLSYCFFLCPFFRCLVRFPQDAVRLRERGETDLSAIKNRRGFAFKLERLTAVSRRRGIHPPICEIGSEVWTSRGGAFDDRPLSFCAPRALLHEAPSLPLSLSLSLALFLSLFVSISLSLSLSPFLSFLSRPTFFLFFGLVLFIGCRCDCSRGTNNCILCIISVLLRYIYGSRRFRDSLQLIDSLPYVISIRRYSWKG